MEHGDDHTCAGCAKWVTYGDATSSLVQLIVWNTEFLNTVSGLTCESLINFPDVDV